MIDDTTGNITPDQLKRIADLASHGFGIGEIARDIGLPLEWSICGYEHCPEAQTVFDFGRFNGRAIKRTPQTAICWIRCAGA